MREQQSNRISSGVIAAISAAVVAVSGGVAWYVVSQNNPKPQQPSQSTINNSNQSSPSQSQEQTTQVYWLKDTGTNLELAPQPITVAAAKPNQALEEAFKTLLAGPTEGTGSTTIPKGTQLLGVKQEEDGIHVNLSEEFTSGGGSSSMIGRIGQVVYTATTLNENANVYIEVNGKPLDVLGGEGLELEQPLTRQTYKQNFQL